MGKADSKGKNKEDKVSLFIIHKTHLDLQIWMAASYVVTHTKAGLATTFTLWLQT